MWYEDYYKYWKKRGFISDGHNFPLDSLTGTGTKYHFAEQFDKIYNRFKGHPTVGVFLASEPGLFVHDPALIQTILVQDFKSFHDHHLYYNAETDPISAHLFSIEGQAWKDRRTKLTPIFTSGKMKMMFGIVHEIGDKFVDAINGELKMSTNVEMHEWLARFTTDVIGSIAFGIDCNCLENPNTDFRKYGKQIFKNETYWKTLKFVFVNSFQKFSRKMGFMLNDRSVAEFFLKIFTETIEYREKSEIKRNDYVHLLLQLKRKGMLSLREMSAEAFIFYIGGFDTSSSLMDFILYELALNQDIQNKLRDEIEDGLKENDGKLTYELISQFKYLNMVLNEGLRKYPPISTITRKCTKEFKIPGSELVIPKGILVLIPSYSIHRDPQYYSNPDSFDPERFSEENIRNRKPFTFLPFGKIVKTLV